MIKLNEAFSSFSVNDLQQAKSFYHNTLGLEVSEVRDMEGLLNLHIAGGSRIMLYQKPDHKPATFTVLNFQVENVEDTVDALTSLGVQFEKYEGSIQTDEKGVSHGAGTKIAWFKDPSGNILSVVEQK